MEQHENVMIFPTIQRWNSITSWKFNNLCTWLFGRLLYEIVRKCKIEKEFSQFYSFSFDLIFFFQNKKITTIIQF